MLDDQKKIEEKFQCHQCHECCKKPGFVYLEKGEDDRIAQFLNLDPYRFIQNYCDLVDRRRLVLKKMNDEACIFLTANGCLIHAVKPKQCRDFPVRWRTEASFEYCQGLKNALNS